MTPASARPAARRESLAIRIASRVHRRFLRDSPVNGRPSINSITQVLVSVFHHAELQMSTMRGGMALTARASRRSADELFVLAHEEQELHGDAAFRSRCLPRKT